MLLDYIEVGLSIIHIALLILLLHRERVWHESLVKSGVVYKSKNKSRSRIPKEGLLRATRNAITGPKGAVLRTPDEEDEENEKKAKKRLFLSKAEKNPLTPLPDGLDPADFDIEEYE